MSLGVVSSLGVGVVVFESRSHATLTDGDQLAHERVVLLAVDAKRVESLDRLVVEVYLWHRCDSTDRVKSVWNASALGEFVDGTARGSEHNAFFISPVTNRMNQPVERALDAAFPDRAVVEVEKAGPSWNGGNETVAVTFADGRRAYLKTAVDGAGHRLDREAATLAYLREHRSLPVPATLAVDTDGPVPYLATAPAPGQSVVDCFETAGPETRVRLLRRIGRAVATLHAVRFDDHGTIRGRGETVGRDETVGHGETVGRDETIESASTRSGLRVSVAPWPDVLRATVEQTREIATTDRLDRHFTAVVDCIETHRSLLADAPAALLHGDVTKPNAFLVDGSRETSAAGDVGLLDWELAHVGDPARDLVRARDQLCSGFDTEGPDRFTEAVLHGYRDCAGRLPAGFEVRQPIYRVVRVLGRSGFLDQWVPYLDEPMETLVDRIDAELDARLEAVRRAADG